MGYNIRMAHNFNSQPGVALSHNIPLEYDVGAYALTIEFANYPDFTAVALSKTISATAKLAFLSLTAAQVDSLQNCWYRIKGRNKAITKIFQYGQLTYVTPSSESAMMTILDSTTDKLKEQYVPTRLSDANLQLIPGYLNVKNYGAKGDGSTDDTAAINAALTACPEGGQVFFPPGTYLVSSPITLRRNRTLIGTHAGRWPYHTGGPCRIRVTSGFTGDAIIRLKDEEELFGSVGAPANGQQSSANDQNGMRIIRLCLDGFNVAGSISGVKATGLVRDFRMVEVAIRRCTGNGIHTVGYTRTNTQAYYPRGWALHQVTCDTTGNNGFSFNLLNDSTLVDCLAVSATNHGFYFGGPGELLIVGCRSVWNKGRGFYFNGTCYGNVVMSGCSTDRNEQSGIFIDTSGRHPILLSGVALRRDGRNSLSGGGNYAGLLVSGATTPIVVSGITTETGQDDETNAGTMSPQFGVRVLNSTSVVIDSGALMGNQAAYIDAGGNTNFRVAPRVLQMSGSINSPTTTYLAEPGPFPSATDHGFAAWSLDAACTNTSSALASGVMTLVKVRTTAPVTPTNLYAHITTAGSGLVAGQSFAGLYNAAGTLIGTTVDQATNWASAGAKIMGITATSTGSLTLLPPGIYYIALLTVGTTPPLFARASGVGTTNANLGSGAYRFATYGTGLTALPATLTLTSMAQAAIAWWVALA